MTTQHDVVAAVFNHEFHIQISTTKHDFWKTSMTSGVGSAHLPLHGHTCIVNESVVRSYTSVHAYPLTSAQTRKRM